MHPNEYTVLLKIRHPDVDPALLTEAFGIVPECSWKAGELRGKSEDTGGTWRESYWIARVPPMPFEYVWLEGTLTWAALLLQDRKDFWTKLRAEGASAQMIVLLGESALSQLELPHELLSLLSRCGVSVSIELAGAAEAAA